MVQDGGVTSDGIVSLTQVGPFPSGLVRAAENVVEVVFEQDAGPLHVAPDLAQLVEVDGLTLKLSAVRPAVCVIVRSHKSL